MNCPSCNAANTETAQFCPDCGARLRERADAAAQPGAQDEEVTQVRYRESDRKATIKGAGSDPLVSSIISGKYRVNLKLGSGGMGTVYRAKRLLIGDEVAIKILHSEQNDPRAAERFRREAQAAARLKHPNAVTIYDFGVTDDGIQYLVMELVEGESLRRIIQQQGPLMPSSAAEIMNQVCAALDEAHRHHVLHRDLKPDNIIVDFTDAGLRVKVLDFGIAKLRDNAAGNLTQTGSILGTPHYMSPEQCIGEELDNRSDIYSLGVVLYEMLTGVVPFRSPSTAAVVVQHVNQPPPSPRALNASISMPVEIAVLHALAKSREGRPQSAGALAQELATAVMNPGLSSSVATFGSSGENASASTLLVDRQSFPTGQAEFRSVSSAHPGPGVPNHTTRIVGLTILGTLLLLGLGGLGVHLLFGNRSEVVNGAPSNSDPLKERSPLANETARLPDAPAQRPPAVRSPDAPLLDTASLTNEVRTALEGWAAAARAHDLDFQMTYYADQIDPYFLKGKVSAADVRSNRLTAYKRYSRLDVQLSNVDIIFDPSGTVATTTFDKYFAFEGEKKNFSGSVKSKLWLTKFGSRWLITGERDLKVYYVK
jgi:serine/threonine protein kinase